MYKKISIVMAFGISFVCGQEKSIESVLHNCSVITQVMQNGNMEEVQNLLEDESMREALLISMACYNKNK